MKKVVRYKQGESIPDGARFLYSNAGKEEVGSRYSIEPNPSDLMNYIPIFGSIFGSDRVYRHTYYRQVVYNYYEIDV